MERRVAASEKMLAEIHAMIQALRPVPTVLRPEPALASVSAAFGSAAQMAADSGHIPAAVQGPSFCQGNARATPCPTSDTMPGTELFTSLPGPTRAMIDSCTSASLPLDARIPDGLRAKIWADDYIDLAIMLKPTLLQHQEYSQAMYGGWLTHKGTCPRALLLARLPMPLQLMSAGCKLLICICLCTCCCLLMCPSQ